MPAQVEADYTSWPLLPDLFPTFSPGVKTSRDLDLVDIDKEALEQRMKMYFDHSLSDETIRQIVPPLLSSSAEYDGTATRKTLLQIGMDSGYVVRYAYQPFDTRYLYWHPKTKLLDRKREDLFAAFRAENMFLTSRQKGERQNEGTPFYITRALPDWHLTR